MLTGSASTSTSMKGSIRGVGVLLKSTRGFAAISARNKIVSVSDAVSLVRPGSTISVSGFVAQGAPETLLKALGDRYLQLNETRKQGGTTTNQPLLPKNLTVLFGGGPGDYKDRGLNHLAHEGMLARAIGAHYGQVPKIAKLVLENKILAYALPLGVISRLFRSAASRDASYITKIGLGTFIDPRQGGGKLNQKTVESGLDMVTLTHLFDNQEHLVYNPIPIDVAFIKATTADTDGNLSFERESLYGDSKVIAAAARSSGGIIIAEVERLAAMGSIHPRSVHIPGIFVDGIVLAAPENRRMSYFCEYNPAWSSEIREPPGAIPYMELDERKLIARRGAFELSVGAVVNLGIGMPEGVANVAYEEGISSQIILTTEAGAIGGIGASGHNFGAASGVSSIQEMSSQFDFYDGGGLSICFLGMGEVSQNGDVNVSRLSKDTLTGPGGFIDITQSTSRIVFLGTFKKKGLKTSLGKDNKLVIDQEGAIRTFKSSVSQVTFSGNQANKMGQRVLYVTERCVFQLGPSGLELKEVAPGMDIQKDILDHMDFVPINVADGDYSSVTSMNPCIFLEGEMKLRDDLCGVETGIKKRFKYEESSHTLTIDLSNLSCNTVADGNELLRITLDVLDHITDHGKNRVNVVANYENFDVKGDLVQMYVRGVDSLEKKYYKSVKRFHGNLFYRSKLAIGFGAKDEDELWEDWCEEDKTKMSRTSFRQGIIKEFNHDLGSNELESIFGKEKQYLSRIEFGDALVKVRSKSVHLKSTHTTKNK